jgi:hypothetical protein
MTDKPYLSGTPVLPAKLNRRIGAFITRWAYLENHLQRTCYRLLGVTMEQGRLMVQEHRAADRPLRIIELANLATVSVDEKLLNSMHKRMEKIVEVRDCIAHGVWFWSPDHREFALSITKGNWHDGAHMPPPMRKKKVRPEGRLISASEIDDLCAAVDEITADARRCYERILDQCQPAIER